MLMFRWKFDLSWSFKVKYYRELSITTICRIKSERWKHIWRCENSILDSKLTRHIFCCIFSMTMGIDMSWHRNKQLLIIHYYITSWAKMPIFIAYNLKEKGRMKLYLMILAKSIITNNVSGHFWLARKVLRWSLAYRL